MKNDYFPKGKARKSQRTAKNVTFVLGILFQDYHLFDCLVRLLNFKEKNLCEKNNKLIYFLEKITIIC